jgi:thiazole synthase ThiGH ThiG subunit
VKKEDELLLIGKMARTSQLFMDTAEFDDCETLEDFKEAVERLKAKMLIMSSKTINSVEERLNA